MTALRVETSKQNAIDFYAKPVINEDELRRKKYLKKSGPSEAQIAKRKRFLKLMSGGDVPQILPPPKPLKEGEIFRPCRLY